MVDRRLQRCELALERHDPKIRPNTPLTLGSHLCCTYVERPPLEALAYCPFAFQNLPDRTETLASGGEAQEKRHLDCAPQGENSYRA